MFNSDRNYFMFSQFFFFMGWKNDFTPLGFFFTVFFTSEENDEVMVFFTVFSTSEENSEVMVFFTVFFTENTQFQLSLNKVPFSTCKKFPHEIIFPCLKCFLFVIHLHLSWTLASPRKLGQQRSTWGANGSLRKKHFTARKNDFILETLLPLRKVTFCLLFTSLRAMKKQEGFSLYQIATSRLWVKPWRLTEEPSSSFNKL